MSSFNQTPRAMYPYSKLLSQRFSHMRTAKSLNSERERSKHVYVPTNLTNIHILTIVSRTSRDCAIVDVCMPCINFDSSKNFSWQRKEKSQCVLNLEQ